jgi:hypothetical protein
MDLQVTEQELQLRVYQLGGIPGGARRGLGLLDDGEVFMLGQFHGGEKLWRTSHSPKLCGLILKQLLEMLRQESYTSFMCEVEEDDCLRWMASLETTPLSDARTSCHCVPVHPNRLEEPTLRPWLEDILEGRQQASFLSLKAEYDGADSEGTFVEPSPAAAVWWWKAWHCRAPNDPTPFTWSWYPGS